jgi:hypothetical protein
VHLLTVCPVSLLLPLLLLLLSCCSCEQKARKLPPTWKYESSTASTLVA